MKTALKLALVMGLPVLIALAWWVSEQPCREMLLIFDELEPGDSVHLNDGREPSTVNDHFLDHLKRDVPHP
jgi:hypothetical protein